MEPSTDLTDRVLLALSDNDFEGAVEEVFALYPNATRDEVVDLVEKIQLLHETQRS